VSKFIGDLGKTCSRITAFMRSRAERTGIDHHVLIDGTLKSDESTVNSLSDFSRKAKAKGTRDISVLYAFDLERMEPICSKCFPGNMLDLTSYEAFIRENNITKGIIVADKGFPSSAASEHFGKNPDLHYLNPLKRNLKVIDDLHMMDFTGILPGFEGVTYRKEKSGGAWLYSYRDAYRAGKEERDYLKRAKSKDKYRHGEFLEKQKVFGTVVLESDLDLTPEAAYKTYEKRWEIELVMRFYKSACEFDETRVHDDYSVIGTEFCDFLASCPHLSADQRIRQEVAPQRPHLQETDVGAEAREESERGKRRVGTHQDESVTREDIDDAWAPRRTPCSSEKETGQTEKSQNIVSLIGKVLI
jgi:transposase